MSKDTLKNVPFNPQVLNTIRDLTRINKSIIIEKESDNIVIKRTNASTTIAYIFKSPVESFNFSGDEIALYDFENFHQLFSSFENPVLKQNGNKLVILENNSKINYLLSDSEPIKKGPKNIDFNKPDVSIDISEEDLKNLCKMKGLLDSDQAEIVVEGSNITIKLCKENYDNSFQKVFKSEKDSVENFNLKITAEIFEVLPTGKYQISLKKEGIVRFSLKEKENIDLEIFTADME